MPNLEDKIKQNKDEKLKQKLSDFLDNFKQEIIIPEIIIPEIKIPKIEIPKIEVPKVDIKVNPDIKFPEYPKEIEIKQPKWWNFNFETLISKLWSNIKDNIFNVKLEKGNPKNPQYTILVDEEGNTIDLKESKGVGGFGLLRRLVSSYSLNALGTKINPATEEKQDTLITNTTVGTLSPENSSTTPLGIGGIFTGTAVDTKDFVTVNVVVKASHASATDGFCIDFSPDGTNWDITECHTITAATGQAHLSRAKGRYCRIRYTNGGTAQTYFRLATILKNTAVSMTYEQLSIDVDDTHDAALVRSVLAAKKPNGDYVNIQATTAGNLKVSVEESEALADTPEFFEDTSFVTGDSPVTLDLNTALGRNATKGYIINDGVGNFTVAFSTDGTTFGDAITMKKNEVLNFENISVDSLKITWISDSSYRVSAI